MPGLIKQIMVAEGQLVKKGDVFTNLRGYENGKRTKSNS
jgi:multidrug efflux pump subunit AcrA (membrane-fusion protein)